MKRGETDKQNHKRTHFKCNVLNTAAQRLRKLRGNYLFQLGWNTLLL